MIEKWLAWTKQAARARIRPPLEAAAPDGRMAEAIALWCGLYRGEAPWLIAKGSAGAGLGLAAAIAGELARQTTLELETQITGSARGEFLNSQYRAMLKTLRQAVELGCAGGGMILKPYPDGRGGIAVQAIGADGFVPTGFDSRGALTGAIFRETVRVDGVVYTRLEAHFLENGRYTVENSALRSAKPGAAGEPVSLSAVPCWEGLSEKTVLEGVVRPLFGYFRPPQANWIDPLSPLGVSVYSRSVDLLRQADEQWERILWEFEGGELAVDASEDLFRLTESGRYRLPRGKERLFRVHDVSVMEARGNFLETFSPALRDRSLFNGLNQMLKRIEFQCGLAYGTISDPQLVEKTAEEIRAGKQRSYATVTDLQRALQTALEELVDAMDSWAGLLRLTPPGAYSLSFHWDDSIVTDAESERARDLQEVRDGLMQKWEYRAKWRGEDEAAARRMAE